MKTNKFFLLLIISFSAVAMAQETQEVSVTGINWQEKEQRLTYNLSEDGLVKIRAGVYAGPVYRTLVNLEKRQSGENQEAWDGKDEAGKVDFLKYGKLHFCVDVPVRQSADAVLDVKFSETTGPLDKVTVNVQEILKPLFKPGAELRVYVDNKLKKIERVFALPYTFNLKPDDLPSGKHLLALNLWSAPDFSSVAYKSLEVIAPAEKTKKSKNKISNGKIAFCRRDKNGFWQIFVSTLQGKRIKQLTTSNVDKRYPSWSVNGEEIAYVTATGELWFMSADGKNNRKIPLPVTCSEPRFSPDGEKIVFTSLEDVYHGNTKIWEVNLKTLELKKLVNRPWFQYNPAYSPDGSEVLFTDGPELFEQDIRRLDLKTNDVTQITDNGPYEYDMQATYLNSSEEIVYSSNESGGDYEIYKMDKFGRDKINLSRSSKSCDIMSLVSQDDKTVYFLSDRSGSFTIWKMNIDGKDAKPVLGSKSDINSFSVWTE